MSPKKKITKPINPKVAKKVSPTKPINPKVTKKVSPTTTTSMKTSSLKGKKSISKPKAESQKDKPKVPAISASEKEKLLLDARKKRVTPNIFKIRSKKSTPIVFSLADVQDILSKPKDALPVSKIQLPPAPVKAPKKKFVRKVTQQPAKKEYKDFPPEPKRVLGAASLADILGFNPKETKQPVNLEESKVPKDLLKPYKVLVALRERVLEGLTLHSRDTLKRSSKEDSGDLSGYSQHMADAGTDTFDRDFALGLLSSEQDALFEIEEAIQRIINGTYGVCEITGVPINKERLKAVPFTRYSLEGQKQLEATQRLNKDRGSIFPESSLEETEKFTEDFEE